MARIRSPNYPQLSLGEALDRVRKIHAKENHLAAPREVIAKHLGYGGMNGASAKTISAIAKYDLLEEAGGDKMKVSSLALSILFPKDGREKAEAIRRAAFAPALFSDIDTEWEGHQPSDDSLRSWLIRRNFASDAVDRVIHSYRETVALVAQEAGTYDPPSAAPPPATLEPEAQPMQSSALAERQSAQLPAAPQAGGPAYRVSFTPTGGIEVAGRIETEADLDELLEVLGAQKALFKLLAKRVGDIKRPGDERYADDPAYGKFG
jgi:hypothetical protein